MSYFDIHLIGCKNKSLLVSNKTNVIFLKKKLSKHPETIEIIYKGELLEDENNLEYYKIIEDDVLYYHTINYLGRKQTITTSNSNTLNQLVTMIEGLLPSVSAQSNYTSELEQLSNMGFNDAEQNTWLLNLYQGNIEAVANILLGM